MAAMAVGDNIDHKSVCLTHGGKPSLPFGYIIEPMPEAFKATNNRSCVGTAQ